MFKIW